MTPCWVLALPVSVGCTRLLRWAESIGAHGSSTAAAAEAAAAAAATTHCDVDSGSSGSSGSSSKQTSWLTTVAVVAAVCAVISPASVAIYHNRHSCDRSDDTRAASLVNDVVQPLETGVSAVHPTPSTIPPSL